MNAKVSTSKLDSLLKGLIRTSGLSLTYSLAPSQTENSPQILVEFAGPDSAMLVARNAELLLALEHLAAKSLRLEPEEHDLISFEAGGFKAGRARNLKRTADNAVHHVRTTGKPYAFVPMSSHGRRLLHLALASSGLATQSGGEGPQRHLVLYPRAPST